MSDKTILHDWQPVVTPNGDRGWQCRRCRLTAITLTERLGGAECETSMRDDWLSEDIKRAQGRLKEWGHE